VLYHVDLYRLERVEQELWESLEEHLFGDGVAAVEWAERLPDELRQGGYLLDSQQLEEPATAKSLRIRKGRQMITDGPFSESKEVLGGFNLIEAENMEEALKIAAEFPWAHTGCVEVRPVRDLAMVRQRVSGAKAAAAR